MIGLRFLPALVVTCFVSIEITSESTKILVDAWVNMRARVCVSLLRLPLRLARQEPVSGPFERASSLRHGRSQLQERPGTCVCKRVTVVTEVFYVAQSLAPSAMFSCVSRMWFVWVSTGVWGGLLVA